MLLLLAVSKLTKVTYTLASEHIKNLLVLKSRYILFNSKYSNKNGQNLFSFLIGILGMNYKYRLVRINMNDMLLYNISIPKSMI